MLHEHHLHAGHDRLDSLRAEAARERALHAATPTPHDTRRFGRLLSWRALHVTIHVPVLTVREGPRGV